MKLRTAFFSLLVAAFVWVMWFTCPFRENSPYRSHSQHGEPRVVMECLDPSLERYASAWQVEVGRRFDNACAIILHGSDFVEGDWIVEGSYANHDHVQRVRSVVCKYQSLYPDRTIVLLACNTGHLSLGIPGVYYSRSSVWCLPDRSLTDDSFNALDVRRKLSDGEMGFIPYQIVPPAPKTTRWQDEPDTVGNAYELVAD